MLNKTQIIRHQFGVMLAVLVNPAFAQDWGRYGHQTQVPLAEMQIMRIPDIRVTPGYLPPRVKVHPNSLPVVPKGIGQTPPQVGQNVR